MRVDIAIIIGTLIIIVGCKQDTNISEIKGTKCSNCSFVFSAETTFVTGRIAKNKVDFIVNDLTYGKIDSITQCILSYKDTLCEDCTEKLNIKAEDLFQEGRTAYNKKAYTTAKQKFQSARRFGHKQAYAWLQKANKKIEAQQKAEKEKQKIAARKTYSTILREHFLDQSRDVKVRVHGPKYKYITLTYVLIGDVFVHQFKKSSLCDEMREMGFQRIYLTDGYNYSTYVYWK